VRDPRDIPISEFEYELPDDRIARYPLPGRGDSRLLVWKKGQIADSAFISLPDHLPPESVLLFNDSKVVNARMFFRNSTGAVIEVFCLEPEGEMSQAMQAQGQVRWKCLVGRLKKWKEKQLASKAGDITLRAEIAGRHKDYVTVGFEWSPTGFTFAEVLSVFGSLPIPPYLNRATEDIDLERYQTVYARHEGSVAAPTAGLHFTPSLLKELEQRGMPRIHLQLHVGSGTFKPVKSATMGGHQMHGEWLVVSRNSVEELIKYSSRSVIAVGTTSLRAIESLYWLGVKLAGGNTTEGGELAVGQWEPYEEPEQDITAAEALAALQEFMARTSREQLWCRTSLIVAPPYRLRLAKGLITNFHQPGSTLLLLVAAVAGADWKRIYNHALSHNYRFLSYGDSSLLLP
jgi:S-adenosylmethionine:tRNA ribosyltransferase-isomerase